MSETYSLFSSDVLTSSRQSVRIPIHMRIRIRAVPISFRSMFYSRRLCRARRRRWSSPGFWCSHDTCSTSCAIRGPWPTPVRRRTPRRRNVDNPCQAGPWSRRCRSRWYGAQHRCIQSSPVIASPLTFCDLLPAESFVDIKNEFVKMRIESFTFEFCNRWDLVDTEFIW